MNPGMSLSRISKIGPFYSFSSIKSESSSSSFSAERLNNFIVGVSNVFDGHITRGSYPLCGQYPGPAAIDAFLTVNCSSFTPAGRYVIIQTPLGTAGPMTICEIQVYGRGICSIMVTHLYSTIYSPAWSGFTLLSATLDQVQDV